MNARSSVSLRVLSTAVLGAALVAACSAGLPQPTVSDASAASSRFPGVTVHDLEHGREIYVATCGGCHVLRSPDSVAPNQWSDKVDEMRKKHGLRLSDEDAKLVVRYLWSASSRIRGEPSGGQFATR